MKSNQHFAPFLLLLLLINTAFANFPRKQRTRLEHTYVDYLNQNFCPKQSIADESQLAVFRNERKTKELITINLENILNNKGILTFFTFRPRFFVTVAIYIFCLIAVCVNLRRLSRYNNRIAIKADIKMSESLSFDGPNRKCLIFKGVIVALLLFNTYQSVAGLWLSGEVEGGLSELFCGLANFPNNFARKDVSTKLDAYSTFNDYQYEAMNLRQHFISVKQNCTHLQKMNKDHNFSMLTQNFTEFLGDSEHSSFMKTVSHSLQLVQLLRNGSKTTSVIINFLREMLYWMKGSMIFTESYINSFYRIQKMPTLAATIVRQVYQLLFLCSISTIFAIVFLSIKQTPRETQIIKYTGLILLFSALLCLTFSLLGTLLLSLPSSVCNIIAANPKKITLVKSITANIKFYEETVRLLLFQFVEKISMQSDGSIAFADADLYQNYYQLQKQFKVLSEYEFQKVKAKLIQQQPALEKEIKAYFEYYPIFLIEVNNINNSFDQIIDSVSKQGDFGRLTLRPFGEYVQQFQRNICDVNLNIGSKNTQTLFVCGGNSLLIIVCLALYLRNKIKVNEILSNEEDSLELSTYTEERINDHDK